MLPNKCCAAPAPVVGVPLEPREPRADTTYGLVEAGIQAAIDSWWEFRGRLLDLMVEVSEELENATDPERIEFYRERLREVTGMLADLNDVIEAGPSAVGVFRMSLEALLGDMLYMGSQVVPRQAVEAGVVLRDPIVQASFLADTVGVAGQIPKLREGVQSQVNALADGAVETLKLGQAYREARQQVLAELGQCHTSIRQRAEGVGRALTGARFAYREQQTTESFSPAQALQDREKQLESQGKLAEGAAQAFEAFQKDKEGKQSFAEAGRQVAAGLAQRHAEGRAMAESAARSIRNARFALEAYGIQPVSPETGATPAKTMPRLGFVGGAQMHDIERERERRELFNRENRDLKLRHQLGEFSRAAYQQQRPQLETEFRSRQEFQAHKEAFRQGVAQIAEGINLAGLQFSESIQKAAPGLTEFFDQDLRNILTDAFQVERAFDLTEYLEPFREEMESITDSLRGFMRSMDQTSALTNLLGSVFKKSGGSVKKWEESVGGYAAVFSGLVSQLAQGGGLAVGLAWLLVQVVRKRVYWAQVWAVRLGR